MRGSPLRLRPGGWRTGAASAGDGQGGFCFGDFLGFEDHFGNPWGREQALGSFPCELCHNPRPHARQFVNAWPKVAAAHVGEGAFDGLGGKDGACAENGLFAVRQRLVEQIEPGGGDQSVVAEDVRFQFGVFGVMAGKQKPGDVGGRLAIHGAHEEMAFGFEVASVARHACELGVKLANLVVERCGFCGGVRAEASEPLPRARGGAVGGGFWRPIPFGVPRVALGEGFHAEKQLLAGIKVSFGFGGAPAAGENIVAGERRGAEVFGKLFARAMPEFGAMDAALGACGDGAGGADLVCEIAGFFLGASFVEMRIAEKQLPEHVRVIFGHGGKFFAGVCFCRGHADILAEGQGVGEACRRLLRAAWEEPFRKTAIRFLGFCCGFRLWRLKDASAALLSAP